LLPSSFSYARTSNTGTGAWRIVNEVVAGQIKGLVHASFLFGCGMRRMLGAARETRMTAPWSLPSRCCMQWLVRHQAATRWR
jgi:hypothetical protein